MTDSEIIDRVLKHEGGFVNHPADPGGATNRGITLATLQRLKPEATVETLRDLSADEAREIYLENYVLGPGFDRIKDGHLRWAVVDAAVTSGEEQAVKMLQRALGVPVDGVFGIITANAANMAPSEAYRGMVAERVRYLGRLITSKPSLAAFAAGWMNRMADFIEA